MKKLSYVLIIVLALSAMLISACGGSAATSAVSGGKPLASPVEFTGRIESMVGNEWTVDGQKITVDPTVVRDGPFKVGDTVKVEVKVQADGSMIVNRVDAPVAVDNSNDVNGNVNINGNANSNDNSNVNSNDNSNVNSNDSNSNDDNGNINSNDSNSNDNSNVNSNDGNSNDDNGNNSNDDKSKDDNGNSGGDDSGGGNSNDD